MISGLSAYSPSAFPAFGTPAGPLPTVFRDENGDVCTSFECRTHGALLKAQLQASFPGLTVLGVDSAEPEPSPAPGQTQRPVAAATGAGLASGQTLMAAQEQGRTSEGEAKAPGQLSEEEKQQVADLKQTDARVKAHERAHAAVGGQHAGAPSYDYVRGPDGQLYAVSGEVSIDISPEDDPESTLQKAAQVAAAALAPADPSGADRAVAAAAAQLRLQALAQIREEKRAEQEQQEAKRSEDPAPVPGSPQEGVEPAAQPGSDGIAARAAQAYGQTAERASNDNGGTGQPAGRRTALIA